MLLKLLEKKDTIDAKKLWGYAFETDEPFYTWYFDEVFKPENSIGMFYDNKLSSYLQLNPYRIYLNGNAFHTSYIVGVITSPEYRSKGSMKPLLSKALEEMNRRNHFVSILMPFNTTFYRKYGWELCYSQKRYEVPIDITGDYNKKEKNGSFYKIHLDRDLEDLNHIYRTFLKYNHGYILRNKENWHFLLKDLSCYNGYAYILKDSKHTPVGYIFYLIKDGKFIVTEMAYTNHTAKRSIFGFIYSHKSQVTNVEWPLPYDDPTHLFLRDTIQPKPTNTVKVVPFMCGRIIHFKNALEHCNFGRNLQFSFSIKIEDDYAPWNNGSFFVSIKDGQAFVEKIHIDNVDISCSINAFTQLFFGSIDIYEAISLDRVIVSNVDVLEKINAIFYNKKNFINEYF